MSRTPGSPPYSSVDRNLMASGDSSGPKSEIVACLQPQKCFQFRKPTNSCKRKNNLSFNTFPKPSRLSTGEKSSKKCHSSHRIANQIERDAADVATPTPRLYFLDSISAYYGISEDPYCKTH